ncbi:MAG: hypothetical protein Q9192_003739 [Flavoplaca navasiana]
MAAASPTKKLKVAHPNQPRNPTIFAPFRTLGLVSPTPVPFTALPLGKTTFQITTSVGQCLHTYDLRRGLNLLFITRPQTPALITATVAWKERVFAAWGGQGAVQEPGVWIFQRGRKCGELEIPDRLREPFKELIVFGSWIVGRCLTRIEVWKSVNYEHYTTITPSISNGSTQATLSGGVCNMPTFLNKILVGKQDGSVDIWNVSTGKLIYTMSPPDFFSGAVTSIQPTTAISLVAIARIGGSIYIHNIQTDRTIMKLNTQSGHNTNITSISFRTDGHGAGEDGQASGLMATAGNGGSDVTIWDLHKGGQAVGVLHGAHNPPSCVHGGVAGGISKVEFLPGQDVMVTSGLDNALKTWIFDAHSLAPVPRILHSRSGHAAPVTVLSFLPTNSEGADATGKWILSAGKDQSLWGWSIRKDGQSGELSQGAIRKKAKKLGLLGAGSEIDSSASLDDLKAPQITCFAYSMNRDGGMGAAPGAGGIWANVGSKKGASDGSGSGLTGWESIVTGHQGDKYARTWFWGRKRAGRWAFETTDGTEVTSVAVSSCGTFALIGSAGGSISMFNLQSGLLRQRFPAPLNPAQAKKMKLEQLDPSPLSANTPCFKPGTGKHRKAVTGLLIDPLNRKVISCGIEGKVKFWDFHSGVLQDEIDWSPMVAITAARYYRPSDLIAFSCDDLSIRVIDLETKKLVRELWGCLGQINDFCFSNDGRWIIAASMDSVIRVWDLPTTHLINAFQVESPCTALAFSETGEYLATAHADSVGINLWNNRTLFAHVPTRKIGDDEIMPATLPTSSGERGQGLLSAILDETNKSMAEEDDFLIDQSTPDIDMLNNDLLTLSLIPKARWQTLLHLQTIKARNKPTEPPKGPKKAPFFLPSLSNGIQESTAFSNGIPRSSKDKHALSRFSRPNLSSPTRSEFTTHLGAFAKQQQHRDPEPILANLSALAPSAADSAIRTLANVEEMTTFVQALTVRLRQRRDYELIQTWMSVFLRCHGDVVVGQDDENEAGKEALRQSLREWRQEQGREGKRLDELVGYCSGVAGWLRSTR